MTGAGVGPPTVGDDSDGGTPPRRPPPVRRRPGPVTVLGLVVTALVVLWAGVLVARDHPGGDPEGSIRASAESDLASLVPAGAHVDPYRVVEPRWTTLGCDGSYGWTPVQVTTEFTSATSAAAVMAHAGQILRRRGWSVEEHGVDDATWSLVRTIGGRLEATELLLTLSGSGAAARWKLGLMAPPAGHEVWGC